MNKRFLKHKKITFFDVLGKQDFIRQCAMLNIVGNYDRHWRLLKKNMEVEVYYF